MFFKLGSGNIANNIAGNNSIMKTKMKNSLPSDVVINAWHDMTLFLREFIDNNFGSIGLQRVIKEPTYFELMFNLPPNLTANNQPSILFPDRFNEFSKGLFLGQERELLLMNMLSYALFDLWFDNTAISICLCYLLDLAIIKLRLRYGQVCLFLLILIVFIINLLC